MSIFENGYLKNDCINPNYRGLVGWVSELVYANTWDEEALVLGSGIIISIYNKSTNIAGDQQGREIKSFKVPQFTPKDIPMGELCWVYTGGDWILVVHRPQTVEILTVPYLIAETAEDAERLKDWSK